MISYEETLKFIFDSLPMFHRIGGPAYKANLNNTLELSRLCGKPESNFKSIHIAGTNGKGSVSHLLASVLQESGYKTALFTSPHLKDFRERMRINGQMIPKKAVTQFFNAHLSDFVELKPSFFEMTFALAMWWFSEQKPDIAIIETGMGGRLDSTNIVDPLLCVITNIGYDHMQFLGDTLEKIAAEKAGIIKQGIPLVLGECKESVNAVISNIANQNKAPLFFAGEEYQVNRFRSEKKGAFALEMDIWKDNVPAIDGLKTPLGGLYQMKNAPIVLKSLDILIENGFHISEESIRKGFEKVSQNTGLKGRWQILAKRPLTLCDTGHNIDGLKEVVRQLMLLPKDRLHMVFGMVEDKDRQSILDILPRSAFYYFCQPEVPRAYPATALSKEAEELGLHGQAYRSVNEALEAARQQAGPTDIIFIGGSTFVVAEVV